MPDDSIRVATDATLYAVRILGAVHALAGLKTASTDAATCFAKQATADLDELETALAKAKPLVKAVEDDLARAIPDQQPMPGCKSGASRHESAINTATAFHKSAVLGLLSPRMIAAHKDDRGGYIRLLEKFHKGTPFQAAVDLWENWATAADLLRDEFSGLDSDCLLNMVRKESAVAAGATNQPNGKTADDPLANIDPRTTLTYRDIAQRTGLPAERVRKRLDRWRASNLPAQGKDWSEIADRKSRQPAYLFRFGAVLHIVKAMLDEMGTKRAAK